MKKMNGNVLQYKLHYKKLGQNHKQIINKYVNKF